MISLHVAKGVHFKGSSMFISLPVGSSRKAQIGQIKQLPRYHFHAAMQDLKNCWEVPVKLFDALLNLLDEWDIEFIGDLPKEISQKLALEEKMISNARCAFTYKTSPFPHQEECMQYAQTHDKFLLGDEQGLGKTKQAIDIAVSRKSSFKHCLIVCCVNGLKWNWQAEIQTHSDEQSHILGEYRNTRGNVVIGSVKERVEDLLKHHEEFFLITNIETLRDKEFASALKQLCLEGAIGMSIVDEVHKCSNPTSDQGKGLHYLQTYFKMALTGTPQRNSPVDLYNILKWLGVETHTFTDFKSFYCVFGGYGGYEIVGYKHLDMLQECLQSVMLRRLKAEVLDLPPKLRTTVYVDMPKEQERIYKEAKALIMRDIDKVYLSPNPLVELIRLRQCTGYPGILSSKVSRSIKFEKAEEIVQEAVANNDKVIIFSNWTQVINPAFSYFQKYNPALITGEVKDTKGERERFTNDESCKVILGTIAAMGTGYTLTAAQTVIFLDSPWTRADKDQAEDRAHRIGTKGTVTIHTIVCKDTIDERIESIVAGKGELSDMIVDGQGDVKNTRSLVDYLMS